jgi:hypothetical protein
MRSASVATALLLAVGFAVSVRAQCECQPEHNGIYASELMISVDPSVPGHVADGVAYGMDLWNPYFIWSGQPVPLRWSPYSSGDVNIWVDSRLRGSLVPAVVDVGRIMRLNPDFLSRGTAFWVHIMGHELGHVLGFKNVDIPACAGATIMLGNIDLQSGPFLTNIGSADECALEKAYAPPPPESPPIQGDTPDQPCERVNGCSPIIIALDGRYSFTDAQSGVSFDIDADGESEQIGWTAAGSNQAFLAFDRDGDGRVSDGGELFGNATPLRGGGRASNGFVALAELDTNSDGAVDAADPDWADLVLWTDLNHDGRSEARELTPVTGSALVQIRLEHRWTGRRDRHGNLYKYRATAAVRAHGAIVPRQVYDIFFVVGH